MKPNINQIKLLKVPIIGETNGNLIVVEGENHFPFKIARVFTISAPENSERGNHAHKQCVQFLNCILGEIEVYCFDGQHEITYYLNNPEQGLLIPPGIWSRQKYLSKINLLNVYCNMHYDENDYIREINKYLNII
jgi:dTDP-4-dehydrorhamnose 3,5-epimerase-like enzyme